MPFDRARWLALLLRPFPARECERLLHEVRKFEARLSTLSPTPEIGPVLTRARLAGSQTLRGDANRLRRAELAAWIRANERMAEFVRDDIPLTFDHVRILNGALCGIDGLAPLRSTPTSVGLYACPPPEDIEPLLAPMAEAVEERTRLVHPIAGAALLEQWLVTVHPFDDGNGRTSRLASDWALAVHGYPPASYPTLLASVKAIVDHGGEPISVEETCRVLLRGIEHTIDLVSGSAR